MTSLWLPSSWMEHICGCLLTFVLFLCLSFPTKNILPEPDVTNSNAFIEADSSLQGLSLWKLMKKTEGTIFNNIAQARLAWLSRQIHFRIIVLTFFALESPRNENCRLLSLLSTYSHIPIMSRISKRTGGRQVDGIRGSTPSKLD